MDLTTNAIYGYDTVRSQAGERMSLGSRAGAFATGTVASAVASFVNTGVGVANFFGGQFEEMDVQNTLSNFDRDWGSYYAENKETIDLAGFIAGSFVPGAIGMKALQLAKAGKYGGAAGRAISGGLNLFGQKRAAALARGLQDIASEGGTAFAFVNKHKLAAMGWETADKALEVAAGELMIAATMKQSPLLADDSWGSVAKDIALTSVIGGGILGGVNSFAMNKLFKDTVAKVDAVQRKYDAVDTFKSLKLDVGDKVYGLVDSLLALPDEALAADKLLRVESKFLRGNEVTLDLTAQLANSISRRNSGAAVKLQELFLDNKKVDKEVGVAIGEFVVDIVRKGKAANADAATIKGVVGEYMLGLKSVHGLHEDVAKAIDDSRVFYLRTAPFSEAELSNLPKAFAESAQSRVPYAAGHIKQPYILVGDPANAKTALIGAEREFKTLKDAWDAGNDVAVLADNTLRINPKSQIYKQLSDDPAFSGLRYLNTRTGQVTETAVATAADITPDFANKITKNSVMTGKQSFDFEAGVWYESLSEASVLEVTARHAWYAKMGPSVLKKGTVIRSTDISALSHIKQAGWQKYTDVVIDFGNEQRLVKDIGGSFEDVLLDLKREQAMLLFAEEGANVREIAYKLNVTEDALQTLVGSDFKSFRGVSGTVTNAADKTDVPLDLYLRKENIAVRYDTSDALPSFAEGVDPEKLSAIQRAKGMTPEFIDGELGWAQRVQLAETALNNAFEAVVDAKLLPLFQDIEYKQLVKEANQIGAGASTLGMSNAGYTEKLRVFSQNTGKLTHRLREEWVEQATMTMRPHAEKILQNQQAAAELGILNYAMRSSDEAYTLWKQTTADDVVRSYLVPLGALKPDGSLDRKYIKALEDAGKKGMYSIKNKEVADFVESWIDLNASRLDKRNVLLNARGYTSTVQPRAFYVPPIDTTRMTHFAFVKEVDGALGSTSEVTMVVARDAKELQQKLAQIPKDRFEVFLKQDTEDYFKVKGLYDQSQTLNSPRINSELRRLGVLTDWMPTTKPENVLADYMGFANTSWSNLAREAVETKYGQLFEQLRFLGRDYTEAATSQFKGNLRSAAQTAIDPFRDYVRTALDLSKRSQHRLLAEANEFVDMLGVKAYRAIYDATGKASKGQISWQDASALARRHGVGGAFEIPAVAEAYKLANTPYDRNMFRETISKVNTVLANTVLRLDAANTVIQTISTSLTTGTELAALRTMAARDPEFAKLLGEMTEIAIPGSGGAKRIPSTWKLLFKSASNYFTPEGKALRASYYASGDLKSVNSMFHSMMDDLALPAVLDNRAIDKLSKAADKYVELGAKWTGNNFAEEFSRFISANMMDQLTDPAVRRGLMTKQEAAAWRSIFVNRTQGNYITSQRPIVFQGTVGAAVGLFQTYAFTLLQNLARHIEARDARALLTFTGLQTMLFGMNGLPFFEAVNTHIIGNAATNDSHSDIYTAVNAAIGKEMGDWLMYGTASAFPLFGDKMPALYTRGDVNPRHLTVIPVMPQQMPFIDASIRVAGNIWDTGKKLAAGGDVKNTLLEGLEHNGVSRPLAGLAQALNGYTTTSKGSLISANNDLFSIANASRLIGAKPIDESVALNTLFRQEAYKAKDAARLEFLGSVVKTRLRNNETPTDEELQDFLAAYTSIGGRVEGYSRALQRWQRDSNTSIVNQLMYFHDTPYAQRMLSIMEGQGLDDFVNQPQEQQDQ